MTKLDGECVVFGAVNASDQEVLDGLITRDPRLRARSREVL